MSDLISRQAAIDAIRAMQTYKLFAGDDQILVDQAGAQTELMMLPSAQPEIIRCKDCKRQDTDNAFRSMWCYEMQVFVKPNEFCGRAERRTDEQSN